MEVSGHQAVGEYFDGGISVSYPFQLLQKKRCCGLYPKATAMVIKP
jgi:hypothetical protein